MMRHPIMLYFISGLIAFMTTLVLVPAFRWLARKLDVVDRPDDVRKVHRRAIPYLGGLPFYVGFLAVLVYVEVFFPQHSDASFFPMALVGTALVLIGIYDDLCDMASSTKLVFEVALFVVLYFYGGFRATEIAHPFGGTIEIGWLALIISPLWIAGVVNAVNFSDGLDGLAAGLVFVCAASIFAIAYSRGQVLSCIMMAYLMGCTLAFLRYNFNPASVFMGDAGALFLGFILGASTLIEKQKGVAVVALAVPMVVLAVPILDTVLSFYRRLMRARQGAFFRPDRNHLHHRLLDLGLSQRQVVLSLYYLSACMGLMAFILSGVPGAYGFLIIVLAAMAIGFGVVVLRFVESFARGGEHDRTRS
ncbi:MAG: glycosyltransferase family 4 protein [Candidatus Hydrogenedentota bacterium]